MAKSGKCSGCGKHFYLQPDGKIPWHEKNEAKCPGAGKPPE